MNEWMKKWMQVLTGCASPPAGRKSFSWVSRPMRGGPVLLRPWHCRRWAAPGPPPPADVAPSGWPAAGPHPSSGSGEEGGVRKELTPEQYSLGKCTAFIPPISNQWPLKALHNIAYNIHPLYNIHPFIHRHIHKPTAVSTLQCDS